MRAFLPKDHNDPQTNQVHSDTPVNRNPVGNQTATTATQHATELRFP